MPSTKNSLGMAISDQKIYAVVLANDGTTTTLKAVAKKELPAETLVLGRPPEKQYLEKIVIELLKSLGKDASSPSVVSFAIPESHSFVHSFLSLETPDTNKQKVVNEELTNVLPTDVASLHISFFQEQDKIIATAVEKVNFDAFINVFQKTGVQIDKIDVESLCAARAIQNDSKKNVLLIDVGEFRSYAMFFDDNGFSESVLLTNRATSINDAIAKRFDVSEELAISMRKTSGLDPESGRGEVCMFLQNELSPLREEIARAVKHFSEKSKTKLKRAIILGSIADTPSLGAYIQKAIGVRVELADSWRDIENVPKHLQRESDYTAALGAAISGFDADNTGVNLINSATKAETETTADAGTFRRVLWRFRDTTTQARLYVARSRERILIVVVLGVFVVAVIVALVVLRIALR